MALINCPQCSKKISDQSISCPSCGFSTPLEQIYDNNSSASSSQKQKSSGCLGATILLLIIVVAIGYWLISSYNSYREKVEEYSKEQSELHEESPQTQASVFDPQLEQIPMLLSGSSEDGRYFLISHFASHGIENVKYVRRGNESDAYGEMQIDCSNNTIRKTSSDNLKALEVADLGDWYTPTPDWTDQDIVNYICSSKSVASKNIEHHKVVEKVVTLEAPKNETVEKVTLDQFKPEPEPEPVISRQAVPKEVLLSNTSSGNEKEYTVAEPPIKTKEHYNEKEVNKAAKVADDKKEKDIERRKSDERAICEQAIKVNSAYLDKDDPEYSHWKTIERTNCM